MSIRKLIKIVPLILIATVLLGAAVPGMAQDKKITFLTPAWGVPPDEDALKAFEAEAGFTVEIQSVQMADLFTRVQTSAATGQPAADVIFLTEEAPSNVVATGNMLALNDLIAASDLDLADFNKVDFWTSEDQTYGIPVYLQLVMMDYNKAKLSAGGFDAPPTTWAELKEQAAAIKAGGGDEYPIAMGAIDWSWYLMALSMGDPMFDADLNPVFADEGSKAREAMSMLLGFFADGLISPDILAGSVSQHSLFWSGMGVFHQGWQGSVAVGNNPDASKQAPDVNYMLLPEVGNTWSFPAALGIDKNSPNAEDAWKFIEWYVQPENQVSIYNAFGLYPSRTSVAEQLNADGKIAGYDSIVEQSAHVNELPRQTLWWGPFTQKVSESILQAAQSGTSSDEVIDALAQEWNDLKAEYE
ncbi:MAG: extracellular solute-binding protein [Anaerolineae bacterium]